MAIMLKDIAKKAGVSPTTVSLVLSQNPKGRISEKTRKKVQDVAKELGYHIQERRPQDPLTIARGIPLSIGLVISCLLSRDLYCRE